MKIGRSLTDLAAEIERQSESKRDFIAPTTSLTLHALPADDPFAKEGINLEIGENEVVGITDLAHTQIADSVQIPQRYYDRCRSEAPALLADNVNTWWRKTPAKRMVRTLDGRARALVSDRYRPLDNIQLAEAVLPTLLDRKLQIVSSEITERKLYIKAVDPRIERDIPRGAKMGDGSHHIFDTVCPAITISNSEVGFGALSIEVGTLTRACTNLMFFSQSGLRKYHVGGKQELGEELLRVLSEEARSVTDKAVWLQVRDVVRNAFDEVAFEALTKRIGETAEAKIEGDPVKVVELVAKRFDFNEGQRKSVLRHLIEGADLSQYGLANAVTRAAEDQADYDVASSLEKDGAKIIELPRSQWRELAIAA